MVFLEFNDSAYTKLRNDLIRNKGSELQKNLLEATKNNESFIQWIERYVNLENEGEKFDLWANHLPEDQYKKLPDAAEKELFEKWKNLTPAQASHETFWGYVTLGHIKRGIIESYYLAASARSNSKLSGLDRINRALSNKHKTPTIDGVVRDILRSLSGLPARGSRSVYVDCPLARVWWRGYIAHQVCDETDADFDKVFATLRGSNQTYWEELINLIVSENSILGNTKVRSTLIWVISEWGEAKTLGGKIIKLVSAGQRGKIQDPKTLRRIKQQIGIRSAWQELGVLTIDELKPIIEEIISGVLSSRT